MGRIYLILLFVCINQILYAQILPGAKKMYNADSIRAILDQRPYFTLFKDNYFIGGTTLGHKPTSKNSDVKFQISISQRLTKSKLPFDTYLFLAYTQKTFWNVFQKSFPMYDMNFNPGIGFAHLIVHHNNYIGKAYLLFEHESNGRDSIQSRSWNRVTFSGSLLLNRNWEVQLKSWIPIVDGGNNKNIVKYCGYMQMAANYMTDNRRLTAAAIVTKRGGWNMNFNTTLELSFKFNNKENQYFFIQYYNGYGEGLLDYNRYHNMIRIGMVIKPQDFSSY